MLCALADTNNAILRQQTFDDLPPNPNPAKGVRWLEYVDSETPDYDANTEKVTETFEVDEGDRTITRVLTIEALGSEALAASLVARKETMKTQVMVVRDQKCDAGITFNGVLFQSRPQDRENVAGASQLAFMAIVAGAQPGDLRWHGGESDFGWIAEDNTIVTMDAQTVINFGKAMAAYKSACIFAAYAIKEAIDAAVDHAALDAIDINSGWPE